MEGPEVVALLRRLEAVGVTAWVDGGWGVDALLGEETRRHADVDLVVPAGAVPRLRALLEAEGFEVIRDWLPAALAFRRHDGREVDLHPVELTEDGGGDQVQLDGVERWHYAAPVRGVVAGQAVLCCSLETQLRAHVGYEPDADDIADMKALAQRFGCELPPPYDRG
ncbi:MAG: amino acid transporter [Acidimicrobiia bacterium]|nr:amino acid transporter [Acidimicrobiia bacterium]